MPPPRIPLHRTALSPLRNRPLLHSAIFPPWARSLQFSIPLAKHVGRSILFIAKYALVVHLFMHYIGFPHTVYGISMLPTIWHLPDRSTPWMITSSLHRRGRNIQVGDLIQFTHPMKLEERSLKRVVGMPGDFVAVVTSGKDDADLFSEKEDVSARVREEMVRVPEGHCWVAGDNLAWSRDSRVIGPVPLGLVKGKVVAIVWPWREMRWFGSGVTDVSEEPGLVAKSVR